MSQLERSSIHDDSCPSLQEALELVGRRWVGAILVAAEHGARRFGEYRGVIDGISDRLLSQRLKELEKLGIIERTVIPTTPVQVHYALTDTGQSLIDALQPLAQWSRQRAAGIGAVGVGATTAPVQLPR
ncbi:MULTISPECIES: winged helix-turn-helix transcriptional regulator [Streptomyces]|uniref:winged helix-turn-helix transcriptional regulator n=1 Tax=Streptomyces TaxID=1883 RepID=UPI0007C72200|nr:helix-turn-helix domain-containing protein [Streptomyces sp. AS58]